jgi:hypothetical protein
MTMHGDANQIDCLTQRTLTPKGPTMPRFGGPETVTPPTNQWIAPTFYPQPKGPGPHPRIFGRAFRHFGKVLPHFLGRPPTFFWAHPTFFFANLRKLAELFAFVMAMFFHWYGHVFAFVWTQFYLIENAILRFRECDLAAW